MTQLVYTDFKGNVIIKMIEGDEDFVLLTKAPHLKTTVDFIDEDTANSIIKINKMSMAYEWSSYRE